MDYGRSQALFQKKSENLQLTKKVLCILGQSILDEMALYFLGV